MVLKGVCPSYHTPAGPDDEAPDSPYGLGEELKITFNPNESLES